MDIMASREVQTFQYVYFVKKITSLVLLGLGEFLEKAIFRSNKVDFLYNRKVFNAASEKSMRRTTSIWKDHELSRLTGFFDMMYQHKIKTFSSSCSVRNIFVVIFEMFLS